MFKRNYNIEYFERNLLDGWMGTTVPLVLKWAMVLMNQHNMYTHWFIGLVTGLYDAGIQKFIS
jgi:hypothetical protein